VIPLDLIPGSREMFKEIHKTMVCFTRYHSFREADLRVAAFKANSYLTLVHAKAVDQMMEEARTNAASA